VYSTHHHPDSLPFLNFFPQYWLVGSLRWKLGPLQRSFPLWLKPLLRYWPRL